MTETVLALVPDYGLILVFVVIMLASLAVPLPASVLALTAGSFAAVGDLSLPWVIATGFSAFVIGDQIAFFIASKFGTKLIAKGKQSERLAPVIERSENMLEKRGATAVFLSHTILSPTCPYVTYLSGAGGLPWKKYATVAGIGALLWTLGFVGIGYALSSQLEAVASLIANFFGVVLACAVAVVLLVILRNRWRSSRETDTAETPDTTLTQSEKNTP